MNNESTKNAFSSLTVADIVALGAADDMYLNELAARLQRRMGFEMKLVRGLELTAQQTEDLAALVEVTDRALARI
jgi:hypothetical protein